MYLVLTLGLVAFVFSIVLTPIIRDIFLRLEIVDHPDQHRKRHSHPVPRVGGIAIALAYAGAFAVCLALPFSYSGELRAQAGGMAKMFCVAGLVFATGLVDDIVGLTPKQKLAGQLLAAGLAYAAGVQIQVFAQSPYQILWNLPLTIIWLVGCTNAFNLIDGLDGLAAGVGLFATITILLAAFANHNLPPALFTMPLVGCLLAFLRYNFNPASVFLGDCGSLLIGFLLGCYGILWSQKSATLLGMTAPLMAMAIPLLDAGLSIVRRFLRHQPIFVGDRNHVHHVLLDRGLTPKSVALLMYMVCSAAATFSLLQNALHNEFGGLIVILFCVAAWIGIQHLGYVEFALARRMFIKGEFRRIINSETRLRRLRTELAEAIDMSDCWRVLIQGSSDFGFCAVHMRAGRRYFEHVSDNFHYASECWQLRVPLSATEWVNFNRRIKLDLNPVLMADFVEVVQTALSKRIDAPEFTQQTAARAATAS